MKKHLWLAALALIAPFNFIAADAGPSIADATLACALTLLPADFFEDGPLGMPSASPPFINSDYSLIRSKASGPINKGTGAATVAIGAHVNGSSDPAIVILYSGWVNHLQYDPSQSPPYTSLTALKPYIALNTHNATTAKELGNAFMNSSAFCGLLAAVFYHEALHAKLGSTPDDQNHAVLTCEHIAIIHTAAKKACDRAGQLQACIDGHPDPGPGLDCPQQQEGESSEDYLKRLEELKAGLCGSYETDREKLRQPSNVLTALCCFCDPTPSICTQEHETGWNNPCPTIISTPFSSGSACEDEQVMGVDPSDLVRTAARHLACTQKDTEQ